MPSIEEYIPGMKEGLVTLGSIQVADLDEIRDSNDNEILEFDSVTSAVNYLQVVNSATGNVVSLNAKGDDTNIGLTIASKGTGTITLSSGATTGVAVDVPSDTITQGKGLDLSNLDAITTGKAIHVDATGITHTSGILVHLDSAGTVITGAGRLFLSDHTGATTTSGTLNEFKTAANDESILLQLTAASLTTGTVLDLSAAALTTGKMVDMSDLDAITTGKAIHIDATGVTQTDGILVHIDSASTALTATGRLLLVDHTGASSVSSVIAEVKSAATDETVMLKLSATSTLLAGKVLNLSADSVTTGDGIDIAMNGLTTGRGLNIDSSATAITGTGRMLHVDHTGATSDTGTLVEISSAANDETTVFRINATSSLALGTAFLLDADSMTTGKGIDIGVNALTTGDAFYVDSTSTALTSGELMNLNVTASGDTIGAKTGNAASVAISLTDSRTTGTTAHDYDVLSLIRTSIQSGAGGTTTSTGSVLYVQNVATQSAGTLTDTAKGIELVMDVDGTGDAIEITHNAVAGISIDIVAAAATTGKAIDISDLDALTTGIGVHLASTATAITGAGRLLYSNHTGATSTSGTLNEFASSANDETIVLKLTAGSLTTGTVLDVTGQNGLSTGNAVAISGTGTALTSGELLNVDFTASGVAIGAKTGNAASIAVSLTDNRLSLTTAHDYDLLSLIRTSVQGGAGGTTTSAGSVLYVQNVATQDAGTLTDTANGVEVVMDVDGTGNALKVTHSAVGATVIDLVSAATTTGKIIDISDLNALTTGIGIHLASSAAAITGAGRLLFSDHTGTTGTTATLNEFKTAATDDTALLALTATSTLIGGDVLIIEADSMTTGDAIDVGVNALTTGLGISITSSSTAITGAGRLFVSDHSGTTGTSAILNEFLTSATDETVLLKATASGAITGTVFESSATATLTGAIVKATAAAATLTTGAYFQANDGAVNVFAVGLNGHLQSRQSTAPTIAVTTANGITAAAITAGSTDTIGQITTTGTNDNVGNTVLTVTFNKTYAVAPRVMLTPTNGPGRIVEPFISSTTLTTFVVTIPQSASSGATPSWNYLVVEMG